MRVEKRIKIKDVDLLGNIFGNMDENIAIIEKSFGIRIAARDGDIIILGDDESNTILENLFNILIDLAEKGETIDRHTVEYAIDVSRGGQINSLSDMSERTVCITSRGKHVKAKTLGQKAYLNSIDKKDVVFGIGPAGTGKTYLAVAMAVKAFKNNEVSRIIITRPAVEAGESLGFLPGDLQEKVDPYLRPLHDALYDILGSEMFQKYKERGLIEVAPLAYMRGRTLDNSFIILDEAQNTTNEQMKMFITRFGFGSKVVVNGDITQIDLPGGKKSGLKNAVEVLSNIEEIGFIYLTEHDVVRHSLVKKIIVEYAEFDKLQKEKRSEKEKKQIDATVCRR